MTKYRISVDKEKCIGCGACIATCSACFEMVEGKAKPKKGICKDNCCKEAAENCPVQSIKVEEVK